MAEQAGVHNANVIRIGTLSKERLGSAGGFVCGSRAACSRLANRALEVTCSRPLLPRRQEPRAHGSTLLRSRAANSAPRPGRAVARRAARQSWNTGRSASQIIPISSSRAWSRGGGMPQHFGNAGAGPGDPAAVGAAGRVAAAAKPDGGARGGDDWGVVGGAWMRWAPGVAGLLGKVLRSPVVGKSGVQPYAQVALA